MDEFLERMSCVRRFLTLKNAAFGSPLGSHELEDTLQSTLLALWRKRASFDGYGLLESWAFRFSYLELLNRLQTLRRRPRRLEDVVEHEGSEPAAQVASDPFEYEALYRALDRLDAPAAELVRAKHLAALTFEEIAAREKLPINTVKTRYYRALERLRGLLASGPEVEVAGGRP